MGIVGTVGSGKSSLLSAVLGEMEIKSGDVRVEGSVAYTSQIVRNRCYQSKLVTLGSHNYKVENSRHNSKLLCKELLGITVPSSITRFKSQVTSKITALRSMFSRHYS